MCYDLKCGIWFKYNYSCGMWAETLDLSLNMYRIATTDPGEPNCGSIVMRLARGFHFRASLILPCWEPLKQLNNN